MTIPPFEAPVNLLLVPLCGAVLVAVLGRGSARFGGGLTVLAPVFGLISLTIRLDTKGPAVFKQTRLGKNGKPFTFYKFRSMQTGTDSDVHKKYMTKLIRGESNASLRGKSGAYKIEEDKRVTRVGKFIRRTSLDELPQLYNVLKGEMSLVGPRPALEYEYDLYAPQHKRRLDVLPGMTGLWQVSGRTEKTFEEMVELDTAYIDNWSPSLDVKILWRTVFAVLSRKGAW